MPNRTIVVYNPVRFLGDAWLPVLWAQAKTYYQRHGAKLKDWHWAPCTADIFADDTSAVKTYLEKTQPDVFAVSLYVWNYTIAHEIAQWVKQRWPHCLIITGGPHQYLKHDQEWFKKHPWIDASLPGDSYGELCFQEVLDNLDAQGSLDWNLVTDVCYPKGRSRLVTHSTKRASRADRAAFDYDWSAFSQQLSELLQYIVVAKQYNTNTKVLSIFETTRGCPYGCTFCDWGGGINTKVLKRSNDCVKQDIDALCQLALDYVFISDANLGIFGQRDVDIMQYLADHRYQTTQTFKLGYGGFAKTENRLTHIRDILAINIRHDLSHMGDIKISMQSLDAEVLKNIDRKNVSLDKQIELFRSIPGVTNPPIYVEMILGLPGMNLDLFYHELDIFGSHNLSARWYPWELLPEAPAYSREYRQQHGIGVVTKKVEWWADANTSNLKEIVVSASSYTVDNYLEMLLATSLYKVFVQGGALSRTRAWLEQTGVPLGQFIRSIYQDFLPLTPLLDPVVAAWQQVQTDENLGCLVPYQNKRIYIAHYFPAVAFFEPTKFLIPLCDWIRSQYRCPANIIDQDMLECITADNYRGSNWKGFYRWDYNGKDGNDYRDTVGYLSLYMEFKHTGFILRANKRWLGLV